MARRLGKIKSCKNLAMFHARFCQDNVRQEIAKTSYINLAKFLARFWQDHARQSRQEIAKMCYKILAKFLARLRQESCMALVMIFITLESTALSLSCLTLKSDLYF